VNSYEKEAHKIRVAELHVEKAEASPNMTISKNAIRVVGVAREDAKVIDTTTGTPLTGLNVATRTMVNGREREDWHRVTLWGTTAEAARDIKAGDTVAIDGALRHKTFTGRDGHEHRGSTIDGRQFQVLERGLAKAVEPLVRRNGKVLDRGM
jgi:single-stranded DNA-binding protein